MDDFLKIFEGINSENFQEKLLDIQDRFKTLVSEKEELEKTIGTQNEKIENLRDTNQRLYLRASAGNYQENTEEETQAPTLDDIINNI